jgi:hypothetical protein
VRINQLGYLRRGPKQATWVTDVLSPTEFTVVAYDGSVALRGLDKLERHLDTMADQPEKQEDLS